MTDKPRQARWTQTRTRLLDASIASLTEIGYARTTLRTIQDRAGVSRGALMHHFSSMSELLVAAVGRVAERQLADLAQALDALPASARGAAEPIRVLHQFMTGPVFLAGLELWFAGRTDAALREALIPAERRVGEALWKLLHDQAANGGDTALDRTRLAELLALLRGLAVTSVLRHDGKLESDVLEGWIARAAH